MAVPAAWLAREGALTRLIANGDDRAFKTLLLLVWEAAGQDTATFFVVETYLRLVRAQLAAEGVPFETLTLKALAAKTGLRANRLQRACARLLRETG